MSANTIISLILSVGALGFAVWVIKEELSFRKAVRKDVKLETFLEKWLAKWLAKLKRELLFESGPYCTKTMNKHSELLKKTLEKKSSIITKIKIGSDVEFKKQGNKLYKVFTEPNIINRVELAKLEKNKNQHFILIDGKHLIISTTDDKGIAQEMISLTRNRKKGKQFRDHFYEQWENLDHYNIKEI